MQDFATSQDFNDALSVLISEFTGGHPGAGQVALAALNILSFGTGQVLGAGGSPPVMASAPASDADKVALLQSVQAHVSKSTVGVAAFPWNQLPWAQLFAIAYELLRKYLPWLPTP